MRPNASRPAWPSCLAGFQAPQGPEAGPPVPRPPNFAVGMRGPCLPTDVALARGLADHPGAHRPDTGSCRAREPLGRFSCHAAGPVTESLHMLPDQVLKEDIRFCLGRNQSGRSPAHRRLQLEQLTAGADRVRSAPASRSSGAAGGIAHVIFRLAAPLCHRAAEIA